MKKVYLYLALAATVACGCAKSPTVGLNDAAKRYFDAWMQVNHPDASPTALGSYIIESKEGAGAVAGDAETTPYVWVDYTIRSLDGKVQDSNSEALARQLGTYSPQNYYGPEVWQREGHALPAGLDEVLSSMRAGGSVKVIVPGWLQTNNRYDSEAEYLANVSGSSSSVMYELTLHDLIRDEKKWEADSIGRYIAHHFPGKSVLDSLRYGFYYFRTGEPSSERVIPADTTVYINYIGRLLNGTVFDTNIKDSAKFYGIYNASRAYAPSLVQWYSSSSEDEEKEDYKDIKLDSSSIIEGFAYALSQMHPHEKGTALFHSGAAYKESGSGDAIPGFSPLRFDIEIVDKP